MAALFGGALDYFTCSARLGGILIRILGEVGQLGRARMAHGWASPTVLLLTNDNLTALDIASALDRRHSAASRSNCRHGSRTRILRTWWRRRMHGAAGLAETFFRPPFPISAPAGVEDLFVDVSVFGRCVGVAFRMGNSHVRSRRRCRPVERVTCFVFLCKPHLRFLSVSDSLPLRPSVHSVAPPVPRGRSPRVKYCKSSNAWLFDPSG